ncbi:MAG: acyltransferase family protein [Janibacter sp.]
MRAIISSVRGSGGSRTPGGAEGGDRVISATRGKRNGALDGLRGLAVMAVMGYHVVSDPFTGGWLGVDVFFVLSGFLICSMLLRERARTHTIDYVRFLRRRARRLLPGLALVLLAILGAASFVETAGRRRDVAIDVASSALQVSNWRLIIANESYFAKVAAPSPIRHTWSLAVQEQFYFVFPLVLLLLFAVLRTYRSLAVVFGVLAALSLGWMIFLYEPGTDPSRVYYGTGTRLFELLIGVIGAILLHRRAQIARKRVRAAGPRLWSHTAERTIGWLGLLSLGLLVVWMFTVSEFSPWLFMGGIAGIGIMTMVMITAATSPVPNVMTRLLATRPLMKIGDMSYSLYIWHWPIIVYLAPLLKDSSELVRQIAAVIMTIVIASLSYHFVENPIHRHGLSGLWPRFPRLGRNLAFGAVPALVAGAVALAMTPGVSMASDDLTVTPPEDPHYGKSAASLPAGTPKHEVVLVGASTAAGLGSRGQIEKTPDIDPRVVASLGCVPYVRDEVPDGGLPPESAACTDFRAKWVEEVEAAKSPTVVFFTPSRIFSDYRVDGKVVKPPSREHDEVVTGILDEFATKARKAGAGRVAILNMSCHERPDFGDNDAVTRSNSLEMVHHLNELVARWAHENDADVYDNYALLCPGDQYYGTINDKPLYDDGLHYTKQSAPLIWRWLAGEVREHSTTG